MNTFYLNYHNNIPSIDDKENSHINKLYRQTKNKCIYLSTSFREIYENVIQAYLENKKWLLHEYKYDWFQYFNKWNQFRQKKLFYVNKIIKDDSKIKGFETNMNLMFIMSFMTITMQHWFSFFVLFPKYSSFESLHNLLKKCKEYCHFDMLYEDLTLSFLVSIDQMSEMSNRMEIFYSDNKTRMSQKITFHKTKMDIYSKLENKLKLFITNEQLLLSEDAFLKLPSKKTSYIREKILYYYLESIIRDLFASYMKIKIKKMNGNDIVTICQNIYIERLVYLYFISRFLTILQCNLIHTKFDLFSNYFSYSFVDELNSELTSISVHEKLHKWHLITKSKEYLETKYFIRCLLSSF